MMAGVRKPSPNRSHDRQAHDPKSDHLLTSTKAGTAPKGGRLRANVDFPKRTQPCDRPKADKGWKAAIGVEPDDQA
jgi:hypothetical protein